MCKPHPWLVLQITVKQNVVHILSQYLHVKEKGADNGKFEWMKSSDNCSTTCGMDEATETLATEDKRHYR